MKFSEKARELPVLYNGYDIVTAGGGVAGIAAALSAARLGKRVLLVDNMYALGGLATLGLITFFLPLCDGMGHQVSFGLAEELLRLSISKGAEDEYPDTWLENGREHGTQRFRTRYNAQVFAILCEQELKKAGVDILYGTRICGVLRSGDRIDAIIAENKDGRSAIPASGFVDATGDADLFAFAGLPTRNYGGNKIAAWYYCTENGRFNLKMLGQADCENGTEDEISRACRERYTGLDAREISAFMETSHAISLKDFLAGGPVSCGHNLTTLATIPQLRMTRCIQGAFTLDDSMDKKYFEDSIGMTGDWRKRGPVYELPFGTLYTPQLRNLAAAGRCISVTDAMWDISRVIPPAIVTGQAAGTALALGSDLTALSLPLLQEALRTAGVKLHTEEVL